jgi:type IV pilus assembly protein PilY1
MRGRGFSGNFLNWATGSANDVLRYSLTGGDRILDRESKTVLQRAVLQQGWYGSNQFVYGAKYGGFDSDVGFGGNPFTSDGVHYANMLWLREPAAALFPKAYFLASEPEAVISAFDTIFASIVSSNYSIAGIAFSNNYTGYVADGDQTYQASFNGSNWSGDLTLNDVKVDADDKVTLVRHENWGVAQPLNEKQWSERQIFVGQRLAGDYKAVAFTWDRLSSSQRMAISSGASATVGQQRTDYLRGDRSNESKMRLCSGVLGNIINSGVVYKGAPFNLKYDADYTTFHNALRDRAGAIYAGANDGMLHAFSAESGEELFAYIPSFVVPDLYLLTLPD